MNFTDGTIARPEVIAEPDNALREAYSSARQQRARLREIFDVRPDLEARFVDAKRILAIARKGATIEITNKCNLFCEGCLFFEGDDYKRIVEENDIGVWASFFDRIKAKGTRYVYLAGAEPSLRPKRLEAAAERFAYGLIVTNGTRKIPSDIPYAIHVSVWGAPEISETLRGADTFGKALERYRGDPRVTFMYTISNQSIHTVRDVVKILQDQGQRISFNFFSPTTSYLQKTRSGADNDDKFFRFSNSDDNLMLKGKDLIRAREMLNELIEEYPDVVVYSKAYNQYITSPGSRYTIDENTGVATDCGGLNSNKWYQLYSSDTHESRGKCCTPNIDCRTCRLYTPGITSLLDRLDEYLDTEENFEGWLTICELWRNIMMYDHKRATPLAA